ncbi:MAG: exopolysaccharide biosynthesis protein [Cyanobacteriota bacterium]|nr:exopolysaccharide biosynthesis protein [Cyanobacteriota bacterium]
MDKFSAQLAAFLASDDSTHSPDRDPSAPDSAEEITLAQLLELSEQRVFGVLFVVLSLPMALPIPHMGLSFPFSLALTWLAGQWMLGSSFPWIPQRLLRFSVKRRQAQHFLQMGIPWLQRLESFTQPRYPWFCEHPLARFLLGGAIILSAVLMALPVPGTHLLPAIGILITGIGVLQKDGVVSLMGLGFCGVASAISALVLRAIVAGGSFLFQHSPILQFWH